MGYDKEVGKYIQYCKHHGKSLNSSPAFHLPKKNEKTNAFLKDPRKFSLNRKLRLRVKCK
jgi:hypothetical protein